MPRRSRSIPIIPILLALFTVFTLMEIWLILQMAKIITWPGTIAIALLTGLIGSVMIKKQGWAVIQQGLAQTRSMQFPGQAIAEGAVILVGGAFLITPGLITDLIGLSTLVPPIRRLYAKLLIAFIKSQFDIKIHGNVGGFSTGPMGGFTASSIPPQQPPRTSHTTARPFSRDEAIDVDFTRRDS